MEDSQFNRFKAASITNIFTKYLQVSQLEDLTLVSLGLEGNLNNLIFINFVKGG